MISCQLQTADFSLDHEYSKLRANNPQAGGVICFTGLVRDQAKESAPEREAETVQAIELSIYPGMTEQSIEAIATEVNQHFAIEELRIIHRYGLLTASEQIVFVGVASKHRNEGFLAAEMAMDYLKSKAVFWKQELYQIKQTAMTTPGSEPNRKRWIEPTVNDTGALQRWERHEQQNGQEAAKK